MNVLSNQNLMEACIQRANAIIKEREATWEKEGVSDEVRSSLAEAAWNIAYNEIRIGLIK